MNAEVKTEEVRRGRFWVIPAMFFLFGLPYLVSYWWFYIGEVPDFGTTHHGVLLEPAPHISPVVVEGADGRSIAMEQLQGKWVLLTFVPSSCDDSCANSLFELRQIRRATGVERERIERLVVVLANDATEPRPLAIDPEITRGALITEDASGQLEPLRSALRQRLPNLENSLFIVDPRGDVILGYKASTPPKDIVEDLIKLLKVSSIG
ncbi:SCO family protein [Aestuariirhabdus litorea]|uniref:Thioredoxin domain-containing protein n=1 Tax=Aestuariirhabdus litorea TaxID=2528527 RepID=A0A3P3VJL7_9GAMM|nr:hypothetical protein [Aestuariirhabdus litorea]RRJ82564.1 hypothetical protein D0544_11900 [Aestuariirhabdus litorea]RWW92723.1 hypothetical protein DZC74_11875 [Endozoicomonadaceae bacterium GTF-13]